MKKAKRNLKNMFTGEIFQVRIDETTIINEIAKVKPKTILFSSPDGYLSQIHNFVIKIEKDYHVQTIISADPCYGVCDVMDEDTSRLNVDISFHIGHNSSMKRIGDRTVLIDAYEDIDFTKVIKKSLPTLRQFKRLGLCTISPYLHQINPIKKTLESEGFEIYVGEGQGRLLDGQIMGCRFNSAFNIREDIDALLFLGQSRFHAIGAALSSGKPTFLLDPYLIDFENMNNLSKKWLTRSILQIYKTKDIERFGVIIGLREGQHLLNRAIQMKKRLLDYGKKVQMITLREINEDRLASFINIDAFVQTACPRISIDGETFRKPILSIPQTEALFEIWDGKQPGAFLEKPYWL